MQPTLTHKEKKYYSQVIVFGILIIILITFLATVGLKLLINLSLYIANRGDSTTKNTPSQQTSYLLAPSISNIPDATNSAQIKIDGLASHTNTTLSLFINGNKAKEISIDTNDTFNTMVDLKKGDNEVYLKLEDKKHTIEKDSPKYKVTYLSDKPKLDISSPHDHDKTAHTQIAIVGQTDKNTTVTINDAPVVLDATASFNYLFRLNDGDNSITVKSIDVAGNIETKQFTVTYQKDL